MKSGAERTSTLKACMTPYTYFAKKIVVITPSGTQLPGTRNFAVVASYSTPLSRNSAYPTRAAVDRAMAQEATGIRLRPKLDPIPKSERANHAGRQK